METICALIRGDLSPAGNPIALKKSSDAFGYSINGYTGTWVDSGTSALALALLDVKAGFPHIKFPTVIIPGYCCPDLVSAAVFAGILPLVVDISENDASYDLDAVKDALDENVIALIAINFLGVKERLENLKALLAGTHAKIIEDNAQWFPSSSEEHHFTGDYVVFSFGRGKPLSLLGGGALFSKSQLRVANGASKSIDGGILQQEIKTHLYNILLHPHLYCYLNRAPFLHLGETNYHRHDEIVGMGELQKNIFCENRLLYERRGRGVEDDYDKLFIEYKIQCLSPITSARRKRLLRYPLLCNTHDERNYLLEKVNTQGLGGSSLYKHTIIEIPGISELVKVHDNLKNAKQFAARLLTLPTHEQVKNKHLARLKNILG